MEGTDNSADIITKKENDCNNLISASPRGARRSERKRKNRQPVFSPDDFTTGKQGPLPSASALSKKKCKGRHKLAASSAINRPYDVLPDGKPFSCDLCHSPYVCNPLLSKGGSRFHRSRHMPSPRQKISPVTGKLLTLCNACGNSLDGPRLLKKPVLPSGEEKEAYIAEAKAFARNLAAEVKNPNAEKFYCPTFKKRPCRCLQTYIKADGNKTLTSERTQNLLRLFQEAKNLAAEKVYQSTELAKTLFGKKKLKQGQIGLGNGMKRSARFESYILDKRTYLKKELGFCERATQRVLCYSNNFLHKKLKTEERGSRIVRQKGKAAMGLLEPLEKIAHWRCCVDHCVRIVHSHRNLLQQWRRRACISQSEARRVLAEMLTPSGGVRSNCYKFIEWITGCSQSTIGKVRDYMRRTKGDREPPAHGLLSYWQRTSHSRTKTQRVTATITKGTCKSSSKKASSSSNAPKTINLPENLSLSPVSGLSSSEKSAELEEQQRQLKLLQQQLLEQRSTMEQQQQLLQQQILTHASVQLSQNATSLADIQQQVLAQLAQLQGAQLQLASSIQTLQQQLFSAQQQQKQLSVRPGQHPQVTTSLHEQPCTVPQLQQGVAPQQGMSSAHLSLPAELPQHLDMQQSQQGSGLLQHPMIALQHQHPEPHHHQQQQAFANHFAQHPGTMQIPPTHIGQHPAVPPHVNSLYTHPQYFAKGHHQHAQQHQQQLGMAVQSLQETDSWQGGVAVFSQQSAATHSQSAALVPTHQVPGVSALPLAPQQHQHGLAERQEQQCLGVSVHHQGAHSLSDLMVLVPQQGLRSCNQHLQHPQQSVPVIFCSQPQSLLHAGLSSSSSSAWQQAQAHESESLRMQLQVQQQQRNLCQQQHYHTLQQQQLQQLQQPQKVDQPNQHPFLLQNQSRPLQVQGQHKLPDSLELLGCSHQGASLPSPSQEVPMTSQPQPMAGTRKLPADHPPHQLSSASSTADQPSTEVSSPAFIPVGLQLGAASVGAQPSHKVISIEDRDDTADRDCRSYRSLSQIPGYVTANDFPHQQVICEKTSAHVLCSSGTMGQNLAGGMYQCSMQNTSVAASGPQQVIVQSFLPAPQLQHQAEDPQQGFAWTCPSGTVRVISHSSAGPGADPVETTSSKEQVTVVPTTPAISCHQGAPGAAESMLQTVTCPAIVTTSGSVPDMMDASKNRCQPHIIVTYPVSSAPHQQSSGRQEPPPGLVSAHGTVGQSTNIPQIFILPSTTTEECSVGRPLSDAAHIDAYPRSSHALPRSENSGQRLMNVAVVPTENPSNLQNLTKDSIIKSGIIILQNSVASTAIEIRPTMQTAANRKLSSVNTSPPAAVAEDTRQGSKAPVKQGSVLKNALDTRAELSRTDRHTKTTEALTGKADTETIVSCPDSFITKVLPAELQRKSSVKLNMTNSNSPSLQSSPFSASPCENHKTSKVTKGRKHSACTLALTQCQNSQTSHNSLSVPKTSNGTSGLKSLPLSSNIVNTSSAAVSIPSSLSLLLLPFETPSEDLASQGKVNLETKSQSKAVPCINSSMLLSGMENHDPQSLPEMTGSSSACKTLKQPMRALMPIAFASKTDHQVLSVLGMEKQKAKDLAKSEDIKSHGQAAVEKGQGSGGKSEGAVLAMRQAPGPSSNMPSVKPSSSQNLNVSCVTVSGLKVSTGASTLMSKSSNLPLALVSTTTAIRNPIPAISNAQPPAGSLGQIQPGVLQMAGAVSSTSMLPSVPTFGLSSACPLPVLQTSTQSTSSGTFPPAVFLNQVPASTMPVQIVDMVLPLAQSGPITVQTLPWPPASMPATAISTNLPSDSGVAVVTIAAHSHRNMADEATLAESTNICSAEPPESFTAKHRQMDQSERGKTKREFTYQDGQNRNTCTVVASDTHQDYRNSVVREKGRKQHRVKPSKNILGKKAASPSVSEMEKVKGGVTSLTRGSPRQKISSESAPTSTAPSSCGLIGASFPISCTTSKTNSQDSLVSLQEVWMGSPYIQAAPGTYFVHDPSARLLYREEHVSFLPHQPTVGGLPGQPTFGDLPRQPTVTAQFCPSVTVSESSQSAEAGQDICSPSLHMAKPSQGKSMTLEQPTPSASDFEPSVASRSDRLAGLVDRSPAKRAIFNPAAFPRHAVNLRRDCKQVRPRSEMAHTSLSVVSPTRRDDCNTVKESLTVHAGTRASSKSPHATGPVANTSSVGATPAIGGKPKQARKAKSANVTSTRQSNKKLESYSEYPVDMEVSSSSEKVNVTTLQSFHHQGASATIPTPVTARGASPAADSMAERTEKSYPVPFQLCSQTNSSSQTHFQTPDALSHLLSNGIPPLASVPSTNSFTVGAVPPISYQESQQHFPQTSFTSWHRDRVLLESPLRALDSDLEDASHDTDILQGHGIQHFLSSSSSRSRNSSGASSIEPSITIDSSSLPFDLMQLLAQHGLSLAVTEVVPPSPGEDV